ncbi:MAG: DUF167 domain-containing protein [Candidatus Sungbacteria bacterium]|nr:DUF167 domain-containing protein [Candidatus Sungbacteria bacterium]
MKIFVMAKPNAKEEYIEKIDPPSPHGFGRAREARFIVAVKEPPVQGRANAAIIKALAGHFDVPISRVRIVSGHTSRQKIIEIEQFLE